MLHNKLNNQLFSDGHGMLMYLIIIVQITRHRLLLIHCHDWDKVLLKRKQIKKRIRREKAKIKGNHPNIELDRNDEDDSNPKHMKKSFNLNFDKFRKNFYDNYKTRLHTSLTPSR